MKTLKEMIKVMQDFDNGAKVEYYYNNNQVWCPTTNPCWDWETSDYRIKPEPTYIPYTKDTWRQDIDKFTSMFVINKNTGSYHRVMNIRNEMNEIGVAYCGRLNFLALFQAFIWSDGSPCGTIKQD